MPLIMLVKWFRSLMVNSDEEKMMKDSSNIVWPMQKQFKEDFGHEIVGYFKPKAKWEQFEVVID